MVGPPHEGMHRVFQKDPELLTRTCEKVLRVAFPKPREFAVLNADVTEIRPMERRMDTLLKATTADGGSYLLVVEAQSRPDEAKKRSWGYYLAYLHDKYECDPLLIVVTQELRTARWAERPIRVGLPTWPSLTVRPLVLGPHNVPRITDLTVMLEDPSMAVFSAMCHGKGDDADAILEPLVDALKTVDPEVAMVYVEFVESCLADPKARDKWRELMAPVNYFFKNPAAQLVRDEGLEEGKELGKEAGVAEGKALSVLDVLGLRGFGVSESVREQVMACQDLELLGKWLRRALSVSSAEELFLECGT